MRKFLISGLLSVFLINNVFITNAFAVNGSGRNKGKVQNLANSSSEIVVSDVKASAGGSINTYIDNQNRKVVADLDGTETKPVKKTTKKKNASTTKKEKTTQKKTPGEPPQEHQPKDEVPVALLGELEIEWDEKVPIPDNEWHISEGVVSSYEEGKNRAIWYLQHHEGKINIIELLKVIVWGAKEYTEETPEVVEEQSEPVKNKEIVSEEKWGYGKVLRYDWEIINLSDPNVPIKKETTKKLKLTTTFEYTGKYCITAVPLCRWIKGYSKVTIVNGKPKREFIETDRREDYDKKRKHTFSLIIGLEDLGKPITIPRVEAVDELVE